MSPMTKRPRNGVDERQQLIRNRIYRNTLVVMTVLLMINGALGNWSGDTFDASTSILVVCAMIAYVWGMWMEVAFADNGKRGAMAALLLIFGTLRALIVHENQLQWHLGTLWAFDVNGILVGAAFWIASIATIVRMVQLRHEEQDALTA